MRDGNGRHAAQCALACQEVQATDFHTFANQYCIQSAEIEETEGFEEAQLSKDESKQRTCFVLGKKDTAEGRETEQGAVARAVECNQGFRANECFQWK